MKINRLANEMKTGWTLITADEIASLVAEVAVLVVQRGRRRAVRSTPLHGRSHGALRPRLRGEHGVDLLKQQGQLSCKQLIFSCRFSAVV